MSDQYRQLAQQIKQWGKQAGFSHVGISDLDVSAHEAYYRQWLEANYHGEMDYMQRHAQMRLQPQQLQPGALRVISLTMDYRHDIIGSDEQMQTLLNQPDKAYISRYALGRDYHKLIRKRLAKLSQKIEDYAQQRLNQRAFVDSAPLLERALAEKSGLGWIGKNTMLINPKAGSYFFLGEILTDLALPLDMPQQQMHCGSCSACLPACPTDAFVSAHQLDARKCISYLTIELKGSIPTELRPKMGNRIFGCDDCQIVCPWNKFSQSASVDDFKPRHRLDDVELLSLFSWTENEFLSKTEGSAIRRIGYQRWLRNIAVALGNAQPSAAIQQSLKAKLNDATVGELAKEHISWALQRQQATAKA